MNGSYDQYVKDCIKENKKPVCYENWKILIERTANALKWFTKGVFNK
jgi:hypothetical protein